MVSRAVSFRIYSKHLYNPYKTKCITYINPILVVSQKWRANTIKEHVLVFLGRMNAHLSTPSQIPGDFKDINSQWENNESKSFECFLFLFLVWLLAGATRTTWNTSDKSRHPRPVSGLRGKAPSFSLSSTMLAASLQHRAIELGSFSQDITCRETLSWKNFRLCRMLLHLWR